MFKRRNPRPPLKALREWVWPSMGFARALEFTKIRLARLADSHEKIALGLALGVGISFTPIVGTHIIQVIIFALILRANPIAAAIGTIVGNPATFPFMWGLAITFGAYLFGWFGLPASASIPSAVTMETMWDIIKNEPYRIFLPWALGGYILMALTTPAFYLVFLNMVKAIKITHEKARRRVRMRKAHKAGEEITKNKETQS